MSFAPPSFTKFSRQHVLQAPTDRQFDQRLLLLGCDYLFSVALIHEPITPHANTLITYAARMLPRSLEEGGAIVVGAAEQRFCGSPGAALERLFLIQTALQLARLQRCIASHSSPWPNILHPVGLEALGALLELSPAFFHPEPRDLLVETVLGAIETMAGATNPAPKLPLLPKEE